METQEVRTHAIDISSLSRSQEANDPVAQEICIRIEDLKLSYGEKQALFGINMDIPKQKVTAYIGPSGCGKSTLLRCINRMNDLIDNVSIEGDAGGMTYKVYLTPVGSNEQYVGEIIVVGNAALVTLLGN